MEAKRKPTGVEKGCMIAGALLGAMAMIMLNFGTQGRVPGGAIGGAIGGAVGGGIGMLIGRALSGPPKA